MKQSWGECPISLTLSKLNWQKGGKCFRFCGKGWAERDRKWKHRSTINISSKELTVGRRIRCDGDLFSPGKERRQGVPNTSGQMPTMNVKGRQMEESDRAWSRSITLKAPFQAQPCSRGLWGLSKEHAIHCWVEVCFPIDADVLICSTWESDLERVFAGVEMRSLSWPSSNRTEVKRGHLEKDTHTSYRETPCEDWSHPVQPRDTKPPKNLACLRVSLTASEGTCSALILDFCPPQNWGRVNLCWLSH